MIKSSGLSFMRSRVTDVVLAVVFVITYFASRRQVLALASAGTTIMVNTQGMKLEVAKQFIARTEAAKNERYLLLARGWSGVPRT